jgi:CelD/BcsL family acetyltransferase involved in cellulose biosynthesis
MQLKVIRSTAEFDLLADEWNDLLSHSASHVPFLRHEYLSAWWRTLGGGEWSHGELCIAAACREDGALSAIAPLFFTHNREGEAALMLLGSIEISDYLDIIASAQDLQAFIPALLERLDQPDLPDWQVLDFYNLVDSSPTLAALETAAAQRDWRYTQERLQHCPYIPLPGDWETYLAGIDKKQRHEIRRKMRRAESADLPVRWYIAAEDAKIEAEMDDFLRLMAEDAEKLAFLTESMCAQMKAAMRAAYSAGWLQLAFLEVGGEKAAAYLSFDYAGHIWVYNSGLDFRFREYSPGWVLLGYLLQWANEKGRKAFDFMRGNEDYKYRFGAVDRFVVRARIQR